MEISDKEFMFYRCHLEGRQLSVDECETDLLPAKQVIRTICDADFREDYLIMNSPKTKTYYHHKYVKRPRNGMYLMRVSKVGDNDSLLVFIDTRISPDFIWIEKNKERLDDIPLLVSSLEYSFCQAACKHGWHAKMREFKTSVARDINLFGSAVSYIEEPEDIPMTGIQDFCSFITFEDRTDEIMNKLHEMLDHKVKPIAIMRVIRAAIDAGLITKPEFYSFIKEFDKYISLATYKLYTKKKINPLADDKVYLDYLDKFLRLKDKWLDEFGQN